MRFRFPEHIEVLKPYVAGKPIDELAREKNLPRIVKLASNENPLGPSQKAVKAAAKALSNAHRYVDPSAYALKQAASAYFAQPTERIIAGAGTDALLSYIVKALTSDSDEVLTAEATFIGIHVNTRKHNRKLCTVALRNYAIDLETMASFVNSRTRLIFLANANNPTGTIFTKSQFEKFMTRVPQNAYVVLDEAYFNYSAHLGDYPNGLLLNYDNLIVTRTMSKDYGLAGFRVGFAFAHPEIVRQLYKVKLPFEPSGPAQAAAIAAFEDGDFLKRTLKLNLEMLQQMSERFARLQIRQVPSAANFVLLLMPSEEFAVAFNAACLDRGLILRHVKTFGVPNGIRINTGTEDETEFALNVIEEVYQEVTRTLPQVQALGAKG